MIDYFFAPNTIRIVIFLAIKPSKIFTQKQIYKVTKIPVSTINGIIQEMYYQGLIKRNKKEIYKTNEEVYNVLLVKRRKQRKWILTKEGGLLQQKVKEFIKFYETTQLNSGVKDD